MSKISLLIVDDSVFMRAILKDIFDRDSALEVIGTAGDGNEALEKIESLSPDVVILDFQMPHMNGLEMLKALKNRPGIRKPRIMMLSTFTSRDADLTKRALQSGADDFMQKPVNISRIRDYDRELIAKVKNLFRISEPPKKSKLKDEPATTVVVIGSSAGGPVMLDILCSTLPPSLSAAVVIIQHMPEGFTAALAERLNRICALPVKESEPSDILARGSILVSKAGYHSTISGLLLENGMKGGRITHSLSPPVHAVRPAVDKTFISAASVFEERTLAVLLSGMGSDGGEGMLAVKTAGGTTFVAEEQDCLVYGMARAALKLGCVDDVVPLNSLSREISRRIAVLEG